jgi:hypothetical protein
MKNEKKCVHCGCAIESKVSTSCVFCDSDWLLNDARILDDSTLSIRPSSDFVRACYLYDMAADEASNSKDSATPGAILADVDLSGENQMVLEILWSKLVG